MRRLAEAIGYPVSKNDAILGVVYTEKPRK
jgi:hypothetical protein